MRSHHFRAILLTCTALVGLSPAGMVLAQDATAQPAADTQLQTILVKGKRVPAGSAADTPLATETTADEIATKQITSIDDLGNTTEPGVSTGFAGAGVNIRGLEADRVLTTIDGIPIPYLVNDGRQAGATTLGASTRADGGIDTFDFSTLSTVDIMRGADSSRAGSGALGGAMILRTLEPEDLLADGASFGGMAKTTYDSTDNSLGGSVAIAKKVENTSILFQGGYKAGHERDNQGSVGGTGATRTEPNPADFDQHNLLFKLRHDFGAGHMIGMTAERFRKDISTDLKTEESAARSYSELDGDELKQRDRVSLDYRYDAPDLGGPVDKADLTIYWQRLETSSAVDGTRLGSLAGPWYRSNDMEERSIGVVGSLSNEFEVGTTRHDVTLGGNFSFSQYGQYTAGEDVCDTAVVPPYSCSFHHTNQSDMPDVDAYRVGLFADDKISFGDSGFSLTPGIRFDWFDYQPQASDDYLANSGYATGGLPDSRSDFQFSPKLRAAYEINPKVELFAQWAMGFKAPNVSELYLSYSTPPMYEVIGNPDLESETSNGFEIGANLGDAEFGGRVTAFYNKYKNFIDSETTYTNPSYPWGSNTYENLDRVRICGFEARAHKVFDNGFNIHASFAYANGEDEETGELIDSVPPFKGIVGVGYATETWGTDLSFIGVAAVDEDSTASFQPDGYGLVNLTGWWEPEQMKGLRVTAGVYNLFDQEYYDAVKWRDIDLASSASQPKDYYSEPGRTFKISITQKF